MGLEVNDKQQIGASLEYIKKVYGNEVFMLADSFYKNGSLVVVDDIKRKFFNIDNDVALWNYISFRYNMKSPVQALIHN